ncbi:alcohol dehydrogenase catalytic domain-containing protein [Alkalibaculum sp. M08DMB]|uniref:Alcohol dehydrogenase catalytic domain-containing protein n=1 Tax=Alkalibaculum sporogenes TaxID=2655001 RepID=A0A6A7K4I2_9FIRM|nr:galactitol-1-phosphate 5-dehydrogenase [Alkalibaculum sporogenes]MPW24285.1 alcohol dehydrogenase catalytic domain-containing protein [Alkalibaculum sporogenes]
MDGKMKVGILHNINDIRCEESEIPKIQSDEILVKVTCAGICGTDFERVLKTGTWKFPTILGHEFGGEIVEMGNDVKEFRIGNKVVVNPMVPCGDCKYCKVGKFNLCDEYDYLGSRSSGGFAEYAKVKYTNAYKVPDDLTDEQIAGIDPAAIGLHGIIKGGVKIGDTVVVFGAGPIGHYTIQWAKHIGASTVIAIDLRDEKLKIAKEVGADYVINVGKVENVLDEIEKITKGEWADVCFETAGSDITVIQCIQAAKKQGSVVYLGTPHRDITLKDKVFESIIRKELKIVGSWCYHFAAPIHEWIVSIEEISKGNILVEPLITHRFSIEEVEKAFDMIRDRKEFFNKILIYSGGN